MKSALKVLVPKRVFLYELQRIKGEIKENKRVNNLILTEYSRLTENAQSVFLISHLQ